jgi:hypothetical protein
MNCLTSLTREEFIELSGLVYISESWGSKTIEYNGCEYTNEYVHKALDDFRKYNNEITQYNEIPDSFIINKIK